MIDNSVVMDWHFDEKHPYAAAVREAIATSRVLAPTIWPLELGNALLVALRRGKTSEAKVLEFLRLVRALRIEVDSETSQRMLGPIFNLAKKHALSTYDASYLDLAIRNQLPLASLDKPLLRAANAESVPCFKP